MRFDEKLWNAMRLKGFNQQRLARVSGVSDSEVSRILAGKSVPGLDNALKLAHAVGASLDFLADDSLDDDPLRGPETDCGRELLDLADSLGPRQARRLLETASELGYEVAIRRLLGLEMKPLIEVGDGSRTSSSSPSGPPTKRASSA